MIDSHCHLGFGKENVNEVLSRAEQAGITQELIVACAISDYPRLIELLNSETSFYGAFGIHPEYAKTMPGYDDLKQKILSHFKIVGVGECGLDYHYAPDTKKEQKASFITQIELACDVKKPIIIHTREADEDTILILKNAYQKGLLSYGGVLHCFTGTQELADVALACGFYISASGIITFKSANMLREVFRNIPLNRLLIETDSPYLAPVPFRGRENESSFIIKTAEKLAEIKGVSLEELDHMTTQNFNTLFLRKKP